MEYNLLKRMHHLLVSNQKSKFKITKDKVSLVIFFLFKLLSNNKNSSTSYCNNGGWYRIRTYDPLLVRQMLSPTELITHYFLALLIILL